MKASDLLTLIVGLVLSPQLFLGTVGSQTKSPVVTTPQGKLKGSLHTSRGGRSYAAFKGIPYGRIVTRFEVIKTIKHEILELLLIWNHTHSPQFQRRVGETLPGTREVMGLLVPSGIVPLKAWLERRIVYFSMFLCRGDISSLQGMKMSMNCIQWLYLFMGEPIR